MSLETNHWTELTSGQAAFFAGHIDSVRQSAFSPVALEAGILPLSASKYAFRIGTHQLFNTIMWPDPYEYNTACMVTQPSGSGTQQTSFVRITETRASYNVEGVALGLTYGAAANLYGQQLVLRHHMEEDLSAPEVGARFIISAMESAQEITAKPALPRALVKPEMVGVEGGITARLFRSLGSFGANLAVSGAIGERGMFSERTYDLAHALLKMTIVGIANNPNNEAEDLLIAPSGRPSAHCPS